MAELQLEKTLSIRPSHWSNPGQTDYSEPSPDEAEKMEEKYNENPNRNLVYFATGDSDNPYNWSMVGSIHYSSLTSFTTILILSHPETQDIDILHWCPYCFKFYFRLFSSIWCNKLHKRGSPYR